MCGRTCCTLSKDAYRRACTLVTGAKSAPVWHAAPDGSEYFPSTNIPPTKYTPVLCRGEQLDHPEDEFVLQPMMWGLVPVWHKGTDPKKHNLSTNNARLEGIKESRLFKPILNKNQRCVVVVDGFYEWLPVKGSSTKQPYLVYAHQSSEDVKIEDIDKFDWTVKSEDGVWDGPRPLFMAAIYSTWKGVDSEHPVHSYSVITRESNSIFSWMHHRIPAILPTKEDVLKWLDPDLAGVDAVDVLMPIQEKQISWHPVSKEVSNARNHGSHLNRRVDEKAPSKASSSPLMAAWLNKGSRKIKKEEEEDGEDTTIKEESNIKSEGEDDEPKRKAAKK